MSLKWTDSDFWTDIAAKNKPVVMYGMGNGADKILKRLSERGVTVSDFFASDEFVRGHSFHGKTVLRFSDILQKYDDFSILLSFGSNIPSVLERFYELDERYDLYAPDVPVAGDTLFTRSYCESVTQELMKVRSALADDLSVRIFDSVINYRLSGRISYLRDAVTAKEEILRNILDPAGYENALDLGAYTGDTALEMLGDFPNLLHVTALEPDRRNFRKLESLAASEPRIKAYHAGVWDTDTVLSADDAGNRNANVFAAGSKQIPVEMRSVDSMFEERRVDFIKMDVEGAELQAINGAENTIKRDHPDMLISLYHRSEDIWKLPLRVLEIDPSYKLYIRRFPYVPAWDLNLYAIHE